MKKVRCIRRIGSLLVLCLFLGGCSAPSMSWDDWEPEGFVRTEMEAGSFGAFVRGYALKEDGAPVLLHDGRKKTVQSCHAAVFALP